MSEQKDLTAELRRLVSERSKIEADVQKTTGELSPEAIAAYDAAYASLQRELIRLFKRADSDDLKISTVLEMIRIMENELVYLQNFIVEPSTDHQILAGLATEFLRNLENRPDVLSPLEATYYRGIAAIFAGDYEAARGAFAAACESEESDESNDIKYKSFVILGHLSHEAHDYEQARSLHERSVRYSQNDNVTAQALALKALNCYALKEYDEALSLFQQALSLFKPAQPFFNSYFYRNALLFEAAIHVERKEFEPAEALYRRAAAEAQPRSYDEFEALSQLGKICFRTGRFDEAASTLSKAVEAHGGGADNESLLDTCFWLARAYLKSNDTDRARPVLERVAGTDVPYERRAQAAELLRQVG